MASPHPIGAGRSAQREADRRAAAEQRPRGGPGRSLVLAAAAGALAFVGAVAVWSPVAAVALGAVLAAVTWRRARRRPDLRSWAWARGAAGERMTAACLAPLSRRGFVFLHDRAIRGQRGNIDHVVIGPPGVFAVETKYLTGVVRVGWRLRVDGRRLDEVIEQVWTEAESVGDRLGVEVMPLLCIHGARIRRHWWRLPLVEGVWVGTGPALARYLRRQRAVFSVDDVADLIDEAERLLPAR